MPTAKGLRLWAMVALFFGALDLPSGQTGVAWAQSGNDAIRPPTEISEEDWTNIKSILDHRCVVCHSCYDAPCQLKLTSPAGLLRGASKEAVYHTQRLSDARPTRLGVDAKTVPEWRALGFFSVIAPLGQTSENKGLLERYLELGRENPLKADEPLPDSLGLELDRPLVCPTPSEFDAFRKDHPLAGMPYGTAPLADAEFQTLITWARDGAPLPAPDAEIPAEIRDQVAVWEDFLNASDLRSQLVSRYLYEHLFLARLHFAQDQRRFFQLVRSSTPPGEEVQVIATRRPFDAPGTDKFYYRLLLIDETIVHKEHLVYTLGPDRMTRLQELFLAPDWSVAELPAYGEAEGGDPFSTFAAIPARSRYQFLLDNALFFVRSFIRGPVCHGETAVDVIEDRFWVSFLAPDADLSVTDPTYLMDGAKHLELPVADSNDGASGELQEFSHKNQIKYLEFRDARYRNSPVFQTGFGYDAIWDGDGTNPDARITVFRHFDNASAMNGFHGDIPETAWVIDFPIFERIYYDLVAGYDVFGRIEHQLSTRLYMDELRMESEDLFLSFLPKDIRPDIHAQWYQGALAELHTYWHRRRVDHDFPSGISFSSDDPKQEFLLELLKQGNSLWDTTDTINRCTDGDCQTIDDTRQALGSLASQTGAWVKFLPDLSVLVVDKPDGGTELFTLAHDKAHTNVAFLFDEAARRDPQADVLTILPGLFASYPNFFFRIPQDQSDAFADAMKAITSQDDWLNFVASYGLRRTSPAFWATSDRVNALFLRQDPIHAGLLDLNRYKDPKMGEDPT